MTNTFLFGIINFKDNPELALIESGLNVGYAENPYNGFGAKQNIMISSLYYFTDYNKVYYGPGIDFNFNLTYSINGIYFTPLGLGAHTIVPVIENNINNYIVNLYFPIGIGYIINDLSIELLTSHGFYTSPSNFSTYGILKGFTLKLEYYF